MSGELQGIHFMMPTPFNEDRKVDYGPIPGLVGLAKDSGCDGVVCLGVMGEHLRLTDAERRSIVAEVVNNAGSDLTVTVGATAHGTDIAVQRAEEARELGATAVMVAPPPLARPNMEAVYEYYQAIDAAVDIPIVVQDFPQESGVYMTPSFISRLSKELQHARYLKLEDPPTPSKVTAVKGQAGDGLKIFGGLGGAFLLEELLRGACGTMTGFAYPEVLVNIYRCVIDGQPDKAREVFYQYLPLIRYENQQGIGLAIRKEVLKRRGLLTTALLRHPGPSIDETTRTELYQTLESVGLGS